MCPPADRLVDCSPLRRNLDTFYQTILPKGGCPFVYLSLQIQPDRVDVNVSPTKNEVHFLDQEDIIEVICNEMQRKLAAANDTRTYTVQVGRGVSTKYRKLIDVSRPSFPAQMRSLRQSLRSELVTNLPRKVLPGRQGPVLPRCLLSASSGQTLPPKR